VPGGRSKVAAAAGLLAAALAGCGGPGPALVDSSTTRPVPATTTATATSGSGTTAVPTTGAIPTTTGRVPLTTGQTGPAGAPLTFRRLTIRLQRGWRAGGAGDHVEVAASRACRRSAGGVDCPGFLLLGPTQIAIASQLAPFDPDRFWHPGAGVEGCPQDRDGLAEVAPAGPAASTPAPASPRAATCSGSGTSRRPGSWWWTSGGPRACPRPWPPPGSAELTPCGILCLLSETRTNQGEWPARAVAAND